ncbi:MAG: alpha/beta hydrolase [Pseudomonadota bacterium]
MQFVVIHGAWHRGELFEATAQPIRDAGHDVLLPTLLGNGADDSRSVGLDEVITHTVDYFDSHNLQDVIVVGHSYAGMIITGLADRIPDRIHRLVYWNAFVPLIGESLNDMVPPHYVALFDELAQADGGVSLPFDIWRESFINDGSPELAQSTYDELLPHPYKTFSEKIKLSKNPADITVPKSYINCTEDTALPHSLPWHPRLSERLGLFRLIQTAGSHELCFTNPQLLGECILQAAAD